MYLAIIEPGSYLDFARNVPFSTADRPIERGLLNEHGKLSGRAQSAVRPISPADFVRIVELGLDDHDPLLPREGTPSPVLPGVGEATPPYAFERVRTFTKTTESVWVLSSCGEVTCGGGIPEARLLGYVGRHDRPQSDSRTLGCRRLEAR